jgi:3-methyladenine DNA glycosylase/8-oxoguanine DNA glycosylase
MTTSAEHIAHSLAAADADIARAIAWVTPKKGYLDIPESSARSHFEALVRAIVYQQLSGRAAETIYGRVRALVSELPTPERVLAVPAAELRAAGLSNAKVRYVLALSEHVASGALTLDDVDTLSDQAVIQRLVQVPGIGEWSAQMFLLFRLRRPDVLAGGDLGLRQGLKLVRGQEQPVSPAEFVQAGAAWRPWASYASLYLWAAVDTARAQK